MTDISAIRKEYLKDSISPENLLDNPFQQFEKWFQEAIKAAVNEPNAMNLSTFSPETGFPSARMVLLKGLESENFIFYTNYNSRKASQIELNPKVALTFFWPELERQVNIEGVVQKVSEENSANYFRSRPYQSRIGAWASPQSKEIASRYKIKVSFAKYAVKYASHVPKPPHWGGFAVSPVRVEFWQGRPSRLHDRILFTKNDQGIWEKKRLAP